MIIVHVGFDPNPINSPNRRIAQALATAAGQTFDLYAEAVDSEDPAALFDFSWSVLNPRTGQTASLQDAATSSPILENISGIWGDIRVFCIATNRATLETSESDALLAPSTAFAILELQSANKLLTLPAIGSRDWWRSSDAVTAALEGLNTDGLESAAINQGGELLLTLTSGEVLNLGVVVGADGADGVDGINGVDGVDGINGVDGVDGATGPAGPIGPTGPAGPSQRRFAYTSDVFHWWESATNTVNEGFQPAKTEVIAGPWAVETDVELYRLAIAIKNSGPIGNSCDFSIFTATPAQWAAGTIVTRTMTATMSATAAANIPAFATVGATGVNVTTGSLMGVVMDAPSQGRLDGLSITVLAQEI